MSIGKLCEFNLGTGSWSTYIERMEQYFLVNNVKPELRVPTLIACVGDSTYELMVDLCNPKKPADIKYEDLIQVISNHIQPTPSVLAERYKFRKRSQGVNETVTQFATALKHLARKCNFKTNLDENLRDQFVCGLRSEPIRQRLFCEDEITYSKAFNKAVALEAAVNDAATMEHQLRSEEVPVQAVHAMRGTAQPGRGTARADGREGRWRRLRNGATTGSPSNVNSRYTATCQCCGGKNHTARSCKFIHYVCQVCLKQGHLKKMCPNIRSDERRVFRVETDGVQECDPVDNGGNEDECDEGPSGLYMVRLRGCGREPILADVLIANHRIQMHVDTGSPIACIGENTYVSLFTEKMTLLRDNVKLKGYDGKCITSLGHISVPVTYGEVTKTLKLYVIRNGGVPLLGREWLKELNINVMVVNSINKVDNGTSSLPGNRFDPESLVSKYSSVFSGKLGKLQGERATLRLRAGAVPVYRRARPLPLALRPRVDAELQRMENAGIISSITSSDWASCLVVVLKSNGALRICGDYKSTVNPALEIDRYPLPRVECLFNNLSGGKRFTKIDLSEAYSQIELDDSKALTVVNTHRGLYVYNRLVYGLASAPSIFQRMIERLFVGIPHVSCFLDDILITGLTEEEHIKNLHAVFEKLSKAGLTVRKEKCTFFSEQVGYLGLVITEKGVQTDKTKIEAVIKAPRPISVTELKSFIGMVNFYSKFVQNFSFILKPLYDLLKQDSKWKWGDEHDQAFNDIKCALTQCPVLIHYSETLPLILCCDASARGVGAVLTHDTERGERPVCYASRTLTKAEANYSQIQREALAIVFGVKKFHSYLYGRKFILRTDHQPLVTIFGSKKDIPHTAAGRLVRWAILLSGYQYEIQYVRSAFNRADALSRLPLDVVDEFKQPDDTVYIKFIENNFPVNSKEIQIETSKDKSLSKVLGFVRSGWPVSSMTFPDLQPYYRSLMWGCRVIVPPTLRAKILAEIHGSHLGVVKCKGLARSYVWWPGLDADIENMCTTCKTCCATADMPHRNPIVPWPCSSKPFERIHIDFFSFRDQTYLVVIDAYTKWLEVMYMSVTTANNTIVKLRELFSRFGVPKKLVSDNGPPFGSDEFILFLNKNGIKHVTSAPYHPPSNGEAENAVRTVKRALKKASLDNISINSFLQRFLLDYRNSIHCTTDETPAKLMFGRQLRSRLDLIKQDLVETVSERLKNRAQVKGGTERNWTIGDRVWARDYRKKVKWVEAMIKNILGRNMYEVGTEDGLLWVRHADQIRSRSNSGGNALSTGDPPCAGKTQTLRISPQAALDITEVSEKASVDSTESSNVDSNKRIRKPVKRYGFDD